MKNFTLNKVVVPWDYSPMSKAALKATLEMVDDPEKIEVVHVISYPAMPDQGMFMGALNDNYLSSLVAGFQKEMSDSGLPEVNFTALFGDPGSTITEFAKTQEAGLIVISSHGYTGLSRLLLGSVAERVVRLAPCPVLVLRDDEEVE